MQRGRRDRRVVAHCSDVREGLPGEMVELAASPLRPATLSFGSEEEEQDTEKSLLRTLVDMGKEKDKLKEKVSRIYNHFIQKETSVQVLTHNVGLVKEGSQKPMMENYNLRVTKQKII